jgi:hypothetical protein
MLPRISRMRIQYASDLHLEMSGPVAFGALLRPVAPVLVLAGDVGRPDRPGYLEMLRWAARSWDHVVVVAGNHELYNGCDARRWRYKPAGEIQTAAERLAGCAVAAAAAGANVHFLERQRVDIRGWAFLGCTLWSEVDAAAAAVAINDYRMIAGAPGRPLTPADSSAWHRRDRAWLEQELAVCAEEQQPVVVVTHHLPSFGLVSARYADSPLNCAFASHCDHLIRPPVRGWIAGHTHAGITRQFAGGIQTGVNPRGYLGETGTGYCRELFMDVAVDRSSSGGSTADPLLRAAAAEPLVEESACAPAPQRPASPEQNLHWV